MYVHGERDSNDLPVYNTCMCGSDASYTVTTLLGSVNLVSQALYRRQ